MDCVNPTPLLQEDGAPSGFVECADGFVHRTQAVACSTPVASGNCDAALDPENSECAADSGCTARAYGSCGPSGNVTSQACECHYGCAVDSDCVEGSICACAGIVGARARCVSANCADDSACGDGLCGLYRYREPCGEWRSALACNSSTTECRIDADCQEEPTECTQSFGDLEACKITDGEWACGALVLAPHPAKPLRRRATQRGCEEPHRIANGLRRTLAHVRCTFRV